MQIHRLAVFACLAATSPAVVAQTLVPTPAATQILGTPAPTSLGSITQGSPAPTPLGTSAPTPVGTEAPTPLPPTLSPVSPTYSPTITYSPTRSLGRPDCNICGEGTENLIGEPNAVVNYPDPDEPETMRRFPCESLQDLVNTRNVFKREDVCSFLFTYTYATCRCTTPEGDLLSDVLVPTIAPANGGEPEAPTSDGGSGSGNGNGGDSGAATMRHLFTGLMAGAVVMAAMI